MSPSVSKRKNYIFTKSDVDTIGWKAEYREPLEDYVLKVHMVTCHSYAFCKFIFLSELTLDDSFQYAAFINEGFFKETFVSLTDYSRSRNPSKDDQGYRELIQKHLSNYLTLVDWTPPEMPSAEHAAQTEARKMYIAYTNDIKYKFERSLRRAINVMCNVDEKRQAFRKKLVEQGIEGEELKQMVYKDVVDPLRGFKDELLAGNLQNVEAFLGSDSDLILQVFRAYPAGYQFKNNSLVADLRENPYHHYLPLYRLSKLLEQKDMRSYSIFPLRRSFIPCHTHINTETLCNAILNISLDKFQNNIQPWRLVADIEHEAFKKCNDFYFNGTVATDGVSVSIVKGLMNLKIDSDDNIRTHDEVQTSIPYIHQMSKDDLASLEQKCVLVDPGTSDLVYCMHETSKDENPITYSYTYEQQKLFITNNGEYEKALLAAKNENSQICEAEDVLDHHPNKNNCLEDFIQHIRVRSTVSEVLFSYYANIKVEDSDGRLYGYRNQKVFLERKKKEAWMVIVEGMKNAFGLGSVFVFGDWGAFGSKKKKIPQEYLRNILQDSGFKVAYVDEFKTSKVCPSCHQYSLERIEDTYDLNDHDELLQPERSGTNFLRCTSSTCTSGQGKRRVWDRNFAAALNFRIILFSLRKLGIYPPQLQRPQFNYNILC